MTPRKFLALGGIIFIAISLFGMFHLLGPTSTDSFFSSRWYFDTTENCVYLIVGIIALLLAFTAPAALHRGLTGLIGVAAGQRALQKYSLFLQLHFVVTNLPYSNIF
jgi:hypothetical protein